MARPRPNLSAHREHEDVVKSGIGDKPKKPAESWKAKAEKLAAGFKIQETQLEEQSRAAKYYYDVVHAIADLLRTSRKIDVNHGTPASPTDGLQRAVNAILNPPKAECPPGLKAPLPDVFDILTRFKRAHATVLLKLREVRPNVSSGSIDNVTLTDLAFMLGEISELCDDLRKECNDVAEVAGHVVCLSATIQSMSKPEGSDDKIRGYFATGTPDVKMIPQVPKKHLPPPTLPNGTPDKEAPKVLTEEYRSLALDLGATQHALENELFHIHWPALCEYVTRLVQEGKPLPRGIDPASVKPKHVLKLRRNRSA